jgi:hypothetical protein
LDLVIPLVFVLSLSLALSFVFLCEDTTSGDSGKALFYFFGTPSARFSGQFACYISPSWQICQPRWYLFPFAFPAMGMVVVRRWRENRILMIDGHGGHGSR